MVTPDDQRGLADAPEEVAMPLLGKPLVVLLSICAVGLLVATAVFWNRLPGRSAVRWTARTALLFSGQIVTIALVLAVANNYGYFYTSWKQIVGSGTRTAPAIDMTVPGDVAAAGADGRSLRQLRAPSFSSPENYARQGRLQMVAITGARSTIRQEAYVYLPPQYFQIADAHRSFPAVEVMTGWPGQALNLVRRLDYPTLLAGEITAGTARPMVLVMLSPAVTGRRDTECTDVPDGPQAMTFLSQDVPAAIDDTYRVLPSDWGAMGDSTGGYCATKMTMMHSDVFRAAVSLSGYYYALRDNTTHDLWGGSSLLRDENSPEWRLAHLPAPPVAILGTSSHGEGGRPGWTDLERFAALAKAPMTVQKVVLPTGGHDFRTWRQEMPSSLSWLSRQLGLNA
jgi:enterochelin esterase-like enzyme